MKHFIKNLVLLPFKLTWDIFLILAVIILQIAWLALIFTICGIPIALIIIFASILGGSDLMVCVLCPLLLLMFLEHLWPKEVERVAGTSEMEDPKNRTPTRPCP